MTYQFRKKALVLLADGTVFYGKSVGIDGTSAGELCFNTGMTGYQEIFTDPSYYGQILLSTNAHIGNYGVKNSEIESDGIKIAGFICKNFSFPYSRRGSDGSLKDWFIKHNLVAVSDIDTRALASHIRINGAMNAIISTELTNIELLKEKLTSVPSMEGLELASKVSTKQAYCVGKSSSPIKIAAIDIGIKKSILANFVKRGVYIKVYPYNATFKQMSSFNPDGYFISNGPGDPKPLIEVQKTAKEIISRNLPLFGICLGHQIIALANGISTYKMHHGHRGINHSVKNLINGKAEVTSQNHGFAIDRKQAEAHADIQITHLHLNDHTVAGIKMKSKNVFSVQYHPEASPGTHDASYLFEQFIENIKKHKSN
ncbi:MAG: glutamine-hydrolyzing carbamoyl-phosphate synthase small subunit [Tenacibaculum sp.]